MNQVLGKCDICNKTVYGDSFVRLDIDDKEWFVYHKKCWVDPDQFREQLEKINKMLNDHIKFLDEEYDPAKSEKDSTAKPNEGDAK